MKLLLITLCVALASADVSHVVGHSEKDAQIKSQSLDVGVEGQYQWGFETENGISAGARGALNNPQSENAAQVVEGEANWIAPGGEAISFSYIADENGYQPQGSHLPTPPPIPKEILQALEYIRAHPPPPEK